MTASTTDPLQRLLADRSAAREHGDSNADLCWLATVDEEGQPRVRTLVLREVGQRIGLFVNGGSPKAQEIRTAGSVEVAIWLPSLSRQWRIAAGVEALPQDHLQAHWQRRPRTSQVLDHVYATSHPQSSLLDERASLQRAVNRMNAQLDASPTAPAAAQGLLLCPQRFECLQIHAGDTLHERDAWHLEDGQWTQTALVP